MNYQDEIKRIAATIVNLTEPIEKIDVDAKFQNIGVDSLAFVRIVVEIENYFEMEFPIDKLSINEVGTLRKLCEVVCEVKKMEGVNE